MSSTAELDLSAPQPGWHVDDRFQPLPGEAPGPPQPEGSWEIAARLIRGYEFADPSLVRAFYDADVPMQGRDMLLELRALNLVDVYVGPRVNDVYDYTRAIDGRQVRVFGWNYRTLEGHLERGQMDWEVWKWPDTGEVSFHVRAVSRPASIANPVIRLGFWLLRGHERGVFWAAPIGGCAPSPSSACAATGAPRRSGRPVTASPPVVCHHRIRLTTSSPGRSFGRPGAVGRARREPITALRRTYRHEQNLDGEDVPAPHLQAV